jgi:hypothetical protein
LITAPGTTASAFVSVFWKEILARDGSSAGFVVFAG